MHRLQTRVKCSSLLRVNKTKWPHGKEENLFLLQICLHMLDNVTFLAAEKHGCSITVFWHQEIQFLRCWRLLKNQDVCFLIVLSHSREDTDRRYKQCSVFLVLSLESVDKPALTFYSSVLSKYLLNGLTDFRGADQTLWPSLSNQSRLLCSPSCSPDLSWNICRRWNPEAAPQSSSQACSTFSALTHDMFPLVLVFLCSFLL